MFTCVEEDRVRQMMFRLNSFTGAAFTAPTLLASLPYFFIMRAGTVLNSWEICASSRAIASNSFISATLRRVTALDFGDFGVLHGVHQCRGCEPRGSATWPLCPPCRRVWPTWHSPASREQHSTLSGLNDCCAADCLCLCSAETMTCANGSTVLLSGWLRGRGPELLHRNHVRIARVLVDDWARFPHRPPTASPIELATGALWVSTGTHPCGPSPFTQAGWWKNQSASLTYTGRRAAFQGDEEHRAVLLTNLSAAWDLLDSFLGVEAARCARLLLVTSVRLQVVPEPMSVLFPPVTTPVILKVFRSHTRPSPHPRLLSGKREEAHAVSPYVSLSTDAWWNLTRDCDWLPHMLVISSSVRMLNGIQHTTADLWPATSFHLVLVKIGTSLQDWLVRCDSDSKWSVVRSCFSGIVVFFEVKH